MLRITCSQVPPASRVKTLRLRRQKALSSMRQKVEVRTKRIREIVTHLDQIAREEEEALAAMILDESEDPPESIDPDF